MDRRERIAALIREELQGLPEETHDASLGMPLQVMPYGADEVIAALNCMLSTYVTMGAEVRRFEAAWAAYCGAEHAVMVNSGSSANLIALAALVAALVVVLVVPTIVLFMSLVIFGIAVIATDMAFIICTMSAGFIIFIMASIICGLVIMPIQ